MEDFIQVLKKGEHSQKMKRVKSPLYIRRVILKRAEEKSQEFELGTEFIPLKSKNKSSIEVLCITSSQGFSSPSQNHLNALEFKMLLPIPFKIFFID